MFTEPDMRERTRSAHRTASVRARRTAALAAVGAFVAAGLLVFAATPSGAPDAVAVSVAIDARHPGRPVPRSFNGLSFELTSLRQIARFWRSGNMVALLRSLGPGVLRFGGASADTRIAWNDRATPLPSWATAGLEARDLRELKRLADRSGWQVLLTIGLAHFDIRAAAREAAAAKAALGGSLVGFELGNEPNSYAEHGLRTLPWRFLLYAGEARAYWRAIAKTAPGVPLYGPDVSGSTIFKRWGRGEARRLHPAVLTAHHYPLGCRQVPAPTIEALLSPHVRALEAVSVRRFMAVAHASAIPFRLDETNTVSCGGVSGISDTFASALWATDYLAGAMAAGMAGINLHGNPANCAGYTPLCAPTPQTLLNGELRAQPEWYALVLERALIGDRPVRAIVSQQGRGNLDITALQSPGGGLHVVVVDDDPLEDPPSVVSLRVGRRFGAASLLALTAPSPTAESGVKLGGRTVARDGGWHQPAALPHSPNHGGIVKVQLPPSSAMLVTLAPVR
jgi:hypothetical protein